MKKGVVILSLLLISELGFSQSTYFNMRYRQDHSLGSAINSICIKNNEVFFNTFSVNDSTTEREQVFSKVSLLNGTKTSMFKLSMDSSDIYGSEVLHYMDGGIIDALNIEKPGGVKSNAIIKYTEQGDTIFFNDVNTSALFQSTVGTCEASDSSIMTVGIIRTIPFNQSGTHDLLLMKMDNLGNELWRKSIGDNTHDEQGYCIKETPDGGYIIGGINQKQGNVSWDEQLPWLIKTDSVGNIEWDKTYGSKDTLNLPIYDVTLTQDGGYAFVGGIGAEQFVSTATYLPWIVKVNGMGDTLWTRTIYGIGPDLSYSNYYSVLELPDGSLVTCGQQRIPNPDTITYIGRERTMAVITKYSSQGDLLWSRNYQHPENKLNQSSLHQLSSIVATPDGGFAAAGYLYSVPPDTGLQDAWIIKVDSFGCLTPGCELSSVPKIESSIAQLKIYPNPGNEIIHFDITPNGNQQRYELTLYDMLGRLVHTQTLYPHKNTISICHLKSGIYNYRLNETWGSIVVE